MKKFTFLLIMLFVILFNLSAEEMQLRGKINNAQQFDTLSAEEQYNSIINSFKGYTDTRQVGHWVELMIDEYGREILPYMNKTLMNADFGHEVREPVDITLGIHFYIFSTLINNNILTEEERQLYIIIINGKIKEYILKYRVIDGTVYGAYRVLSQLNPDLDFSDSETLKNMYEEELGITGIIAGNMDSVFDVTPSPLADYITD